jgi:hypothetical protein
MARNLHAMKSWVFVKQQFADLFGNPKWIIVFCSQTFMPEFVAIFATRASSTERDAMVAGAVSMRPALRERRMGEDAGDAQPSWRLRKVTRSFASGGSLEPAHRTELRARERAHEQCHRLGHAAAIEFDVQARQIAAAIDIDRVDAKRIADQAMQRTSCKLRFTGRHAHDELHRRMARRALACIAQRKNRTRLLGG